jgi:GWxTD domain-containing protein
MSPRRIAGLLTAATLLSACAGRRQPDPGGPSGGDGPRPARGARAPGPSGFGDAAGIYQSMGLIAPSAPVPFVGTVRYVAAASPDSTIVLLALSLANRALTFARDNDRYRAVYEVRAEFRQGTQPARRIDAQQVVRVASNREVGRGDESVIFQQTLALAPGDYTMSLAVRDAGSARSSVQEVAVTVPRFGPADLSSPITVYEATPRVSADSAPRLVASPRATFTFGRDTAASVYLEGYGAGAALPVRLTLLGERGAALWTDTASLARRGALFSGLVRVPLAPLGVGRVVTLLAERGDTRDSARTAMFVSFGDELPVTTFEDMLNYLRYFGALARREALRTAPPAGRAAAWAEFLRASDPTPSTPQNEALRDYFARLAQANLRYREEGGQGWLTDRGMVYVTLGDPDQIYQQGGSDVNTRGRAQIWEYRDDRVQLVFVDQSGFGRWRLTSSSENEFRLLARRREQAAGGD